MRKVSRVVKMIAGLLLISGVLNATTWYVHLDSTLNSIQAGIDSCSTGDTVLVGPGTYIENINFNGTAITVKSEHGSDSTVIDGSNPSNPDSGSVVLFMNGEDTTSVLHGFTITNGSGTNLSGYGTMGGGILCYGFSSPIIVGNRITANDAFWGGGGIAIFQSSPIIDSNIISSNVVDTAGAGILVFNYSDATITNNTIMFNTTVYGGGIYVVGGSSDPEITNNEITENTAFGSGGYGSGAGIAISWGAAPTVNGNSITNNAANYSGGGVYCTANSAPLLTNNTITNNTSLHGAIRCNANAAPVFKFCSISGNNDAGVSILQCSPVFDSCTISDNQYYGIICSGGVDAVINWCNIYGHSSFGVLNQYASDTINAENNWWGDSSGPGGFGPGMGDPVSDYVDFDPWLVDSVQWVCIEEEPMAGAVEKQPSLGATILSGPLQLPDGKKCKVFDIAGRVVEPTNITRGIYFVEIDGVVTQKVVKVR